jgi:DNA polymerase III subunit epsilon
MYLFFDTETNGKAKDFNAKMTDVDNWPRITQLAYSVYDKEQKLMFSVSTLIKPDGWVVPNERFFIDNNMSTERCEKEGMPIAIVLQRFVDSIQLCDFLVAHNIDFDYNVLGAEMIRAGIKANRRLERICTMKSTTDFCDIRNAYGAKWPKLEELHEKLFGTKPEVSHDALEDVNATAKCFFGLKRIGVL